MPKRRRVGEDGEDQTSIEDDILNDNYEDSDDEGEGGEEKYDVLNDDDIEGYYPLLSHILS